MTAPNYPRYRNKIVRLVLDKGFGFVAHKMQDGEVVDIFFHLSEMKAGSFCHLIPDDEAERSGQEQYIEYSLTTRPYKRSRSDRELRAIDIVLLPAVVVEVSEDEIYATTIEKLERSLTRVNKDTGNPILDDRAREATRADIARLEERRQASMK